jgi:hypothetical protein
MQSVGQACTGPATLRGSPPPASTPAIGGVTTSRAARTTGRASATGPATSTSSTRQTLLNSASAGLSSGSTSSAATYTGRPLLPGLPREPPPSAAAPAPPLLTGSCLVSRTGVPPAPCEALEEVLPPPAGASGGRPRTAATRCCRHDKKLHHRPGRQGQGHRGGNGGQRPGPGRQGRSARPVTITGSCGAEQGHLKAPQTRGVPGRQVSASRTSPPPLAPPCRRRRPHLLAPLLPPEGAEAHRIQQRGPG